MTRKLLAAAALALTFAASAPANAAVYDLVSSFSATSSSGVAGVWSYGWDASSDGSGFTAFTTNSACFSSLSCWQTPGMEIYQVPLVAANLTGATITYASTVVHPTDVLNLHPGQTLTGPDAPIDAVVRFTAPTAGTYDFSGFYEALDNNPSGVVLTLGDIPTFSYLGTPANFGAKTVGPATLFSGSAILAAGQNLDFRVNRGAAIWNDSTGLSLTVSSAAGAVPEPATWAMMILGLGAVGASLRSRRRTVMAAA